MQAFIHILLHFLVPAAAAPWLSKWMRPTKDWKYYWALLSTTILVDLDHLLATPIYDPSRCSIGYHPLHTAPMIVVYLLLLVPKKSRVIAIGLMIHMGLDTIDCALM